MLRVEKHKQPNNSQYYIHQREGEDESIATGNEQFITLVFLWWEWEREKKKERWKEIKERLGGGRERGEGTRKWGGEWSDGWFWFIFINKILMSLF